MCQLARDTGSCLGLRFSISHHQVQVQAYQRQQPTNIKADIYSLQTSLREKCSSHCPTAHTPAPRAHPTLVMQAARVRVMRVEGSSSASLLRAPVVSSISRPAAAPRLCRSSPSSQPHTAACRAPHRISCKAASITTRVSSQVESPSNNLEAPPEGPATGLRCVAGCCDRTEPRGWATPVLSTADVCTAINCLGHTTAAPCTPPIAPPHIHPNRAVIYGSGLAGLATARVLSDHFDKVCCLRVVVCRWMGGWADGWMLQR